MSFQAQNWAVKIKTGTPSAKSVLLLLANYADHTGFCYPSQERLAEELELTERTVRDALGRLEEMGVIRRERRFTTEGYRTSDGIRLNASYGKPLPSGPKGQGEAFSGGPSIPEAISGRDGTLPENAADLTGNKPQILPETISGEPLVGTTSTKKNRGADALSARSKDLFEWLWEDFPRRKSSRKDKAMKAWLRYSEEEHEYISMAGAEYRVEYEELVEKAKSPDSVPLHNLSNFIEDVWHNYDPRQERAA